MKPGGSKAKGNSFENETAKTFSLWLTGGQDKTQLIRSVGSGGWQTKYAGPEEQWRQVGDIAPNGPAGEDWRRCFAFECKHWATIDWWHEFNASNSPLSTCWDQILNDVAGFKIWPVEPILVFRMNRRPTLIGMRAQFLAAGLFSPVSITLDHLGVRFVRQVDFLKYPPEHFLRRWEFLHKNPLGAELHNRVWAGDSV